MMAVQTDAVLVQATVPADGVNAIPRSSAWLADIPALADARCRVVWSATQQALYLYADLLVPRPMEGSQLVALEDAFKRVCPASASVRASRLSKVFDVPGASSSDRPAFHYVVETDPETGWMEEIASWYDAEHMPGLAGVTGCVRATRFLNHDHGPVSYACYDLVTQETLGSEPWLAVRNTDWSSRVRPHFTNTRRTMFELLCQSGSPVLL
ncbi:MAG TPA: hypothetical protein DCP03_00425 [Polaromonas sp.]|uniref:hypothetical protein n=1 Tax=Polaromonas sp. UBA4122 TaxID=1947074 RepID=UPI000EBC4D69|nr:hypothetical protein [Polaromonas sp. UBA4122]HAL36657.1 hypothetical protein [Polaromonas sp.]